MRQGDLDAKAASKQVIAESKLSEDGKEDFKGDKAEGKEVDPVSWIEVTNVSFSPNNCPVGDSLLLQIEFDALRPIFEASWKISFLVDTMDARHIVRLFWLRADQRSTQVELGETPCATYEGQDCSFEFSVDHIAVEGIEPSILANCGLLIAALRTPDRGELVKIQMVVQVSQDSNGDFIRTIFNPLQ